MKKIMTLILTGVLIFSVPVLASAQKEVAGGFGDRYLYAKKGGKGKAVKLLPRNAIFNYMGSGKAKFRGKTGYLKSTSGLAPVSASGWIAAVSRKNIYLKSSPAGRNTNVRIYSNEVIRYQASSLKKGYVKVVYNRNGWQWRGYYIKKSDIISLNNQAYDSIAMFHYL